MATKSNAATKTSKAPPSTRASRRTLRVAKAPTEPSVLDSLLQPAPPSRAKPGGETLVVDLPPALENAMTVLCAHAALKKSTATKVERAAHAVKSFGRRAWAEQFLATGKRAKITLRCGELSLALNEKRPPRVFDTKVQALAALGIDAMPYIQPTHLELDLATVGERTAELEAALLTVFSRDELKKMLKPVVRTNNALFDDLPAMAREAAGETCDTLDVLTEAVGVLMTDEIRDANGLVEDDEKLFDLVLNTKV